MTDDAAGSQPLGEAPAKGRRRKGSTRNAVEWVVILAGALAVSFLVKTFVFQAFWIPSESMLTTLQKDDRVLVNKVSYRLHPVHRGDIVVFERTPGTSTSDIKDLIKRVIAVGGDTVESRGDTIYVNDRPLHEPYRNGTALGWPVPRQVVPEHSLYVMGDNRTASSDSRVFKAIDEDQVVGRAFFRIWPLDRLGVL